MKQKQNLNYTRKEMISLLKEKGWVLERTGKHLIFVYPGITQKIILSHENNVSIGVARKTIAILENTYYGANSRFL